MLCPNCAEGTIAERGGRGRYYFIAQDLPVELPEGLILPTCDKCSDYSVPEDREEEVYAAALASAREALDLYRREGET